MADANPSSTSPKKTKKSAVTDETQLLHLVTKYFKLAGVTLAVWFFGWARLSPSWLLLGLVLVLWKERHVKQKHRRMKMQQQMSENEKEVILATVDDLPSWVHFPDVERAEWINKIIDQVWPFIGDYVRDLLMNSIQQKIQSSHAQAASFKFIKIDLGDVPPRIGGVKVFTKNVRRDEIYMDLDLMYASDADIEMKVKGMTMGIKDLHVRGIMRVVLRPLIGRMPLFGGVSVFFLNNPEIDFNLTGVANAIDMPGLSDMVDTIIQEQIGAIMVLPNKIDVPMVDDLKAIARLKYPLPDGVLRIYMLEAKDLIKADIGVLKKGLSDPYGVIRLGANKFKTPVINNTVTPVWNSVFETIIDAKDGQFLDIEIRDEDPGSKDDSIGTLSLPVVTAAEKGTDDSWLPLEDVKSGLVHMKLVWMYLSKDPLILDKEMNARDKHNEDLSSCLLMVNLDSARELPRGKKHMAEPSPFVKLTLGQSKEESAIRADTDEPRWEQNFRFLVHNPNLQKLEIEVNDSKSKNAIGNLKIPLKSLLSEPDMTVDKFYNLVNSGPTSQVRMRLCLRILTNEYVEETMADEEDEEVETLVGSESSVDPPKTSDPKATPSSGTTKPEGKSTEKPVVKKEEVVKVERGDKVANKPPEGQLIPPMDTSTPVKDSDLRQRKAQSASPTANQGGIYGRGRIQLTFRYSTQRQRLIVVVHKCVNLMPCDTNDNLADPYIKIYLLPDKSSSGKRKTQTIKNTLSPVFDETFEFPVTQAELTNRTLELSVKNDTSFYSSNKKFIGITQVELGNMDQSKAATLWFDLQPDEDDCKPVSLPSETDI